MKQKLPKQNRTGPKLAFMDQKCLCSLNTKAFSTVLVKHSLSIREVYSYICESKSHSNFSTHAVAKHINIVEVQIRNKLCNIHTHCVIVHDISMRTLTMISRIYCYNLTIS